MALEVELKLTLSPHHVESLKQQSLFRSDRVRALGSQALGNTYFDTPDQQLTQHRVALRIRRKGEKLIQTLKSSGHSEAGMHRRNEWEWLLKKPELDYALLQTAQWPDALNSADIQGTVAPVFSTDFTRTLWLLDTLDSQGQPLKAEIALDQGSVSANGLEDPLCELELELLEGEPTELVKIALELARHVPLYTSNISKAERGYRLLDPEQYQVQRPATALSPDTNLECAFMRMLGEELNLWPRYLEAWQFSHDWRYIPLALESLRNINALFESFSDVIPAIPDGEIDKLLTKLIRQLRDIEAWYRITQLADCSTSAWSKQQQVKADARAHVLLQTAEPGVLALLLSEQLIEKSWRKRWNEQHQARAQHCLLEK